MHDRMIIENYIAQSSCKRDKVDELCRALNQGGNEIWLNRVKRGEDDFSIKLFREINQRMEDKLPKRGRSIVEEVGDAPT